MPIISIIARVRCRISSGGNFFSFGTTWMFSSIVMWGNRPVCWMTYPIFRRSCITSCSIMFTPSMRIRPEVGRIRRLIIFNMVVLPQPDGPIKTTSSPRADLQVHVFNDRVLLVRFRYVLKLDQSASPLSAKITSQLLLYGKHRDVSNTEKKYLKILGCNGLCRFSRHGKKNPVHKNPPCFFWGSML